MNIIKYHAYRVWIIEDSEDNRGCTVITSYMKSTTQTLDFIGQPVAYAPKPMI